MPPCSKWLLQKIKYFQDKLGFIISEEPLMQYVISIFMNILRRANLPIDCVLFEPHPFLLKMECEIMSIIMSGCKQTIASYHLHFSQASARAHSGWRMHSRSYLVLSFMGVWNANALSLVVRAQVRVSAGMSRHGRAGINWAVG